MCVMCPRWVVGRDRGGSFQQTPPIRYVLYSLTCRSRCFSWRILFVLFHRRVVARSAQNQSRRCWIIFFRISCHVNEHNFQHVTRMQRLNSNWKLIQKSIEWNHFFSLWNWIDIFCYFDCSKHFIVGNETSPEKITIIIIIINPLFTIP
jgi:hypothetical protein